MKKLSKHLMLVLLVLLAATLLFTGCSGDDDDDDNNTDNTTDNVSEHKAITAQIIHINDHHSHLDAESMTFDDIEGMDLTVEVGGFARVVTKIKELQAEDPEHSIILHAGDAVQGTLYYTLYKGHADADVMNLVDFDAMAVGNHEFDDGDEFLAEFIDMLDFPVISANIIPAAGNVLEGKIKPYIIKEIEGEKVGIIGLTIKDKTQNSSSPSDEITFLDEKEAVESAVAELEAMDINKIILLSHYGYNFTQALAAEVNGVDVIVDGDSHTLLGNFEDVNLESAGTYPTKVTAPNGDDVCIVQAYQYSYVVGDLDVTFNPEGQVTRCFGKPIMLLADTDTYTVDVDGTDYPLDADTQAYLASEIGGISTLDIVEEDAQAKEIISGYGAQIEEMKATVIGHSSEPLIHERIPGRGYFGTPMPLGSDIAPIVAKGFLEQDPNADVCIQNGGGVRISIDGNTDITYNTAYTLLPFSNTLFELEMYGSEIKSVLEDAVDNAVYGSSTGSFPYAYGLRFDVDARNEKGNRILNLEVKDRATGTWSLISDTTMYVVITNNFTASGQDGYTTFKTVQEERGPGLDTYLDYAMSFVNYVKTETEAGREISKLPAEDHCIKSYVE
jgi:5'-nucleotidase